MRTSIGNSVISKLKASDKQYDVRDTKLTGFLIRVNPSGKMTYVCEYRRGKRLNIGAVGVITPAQARDRAKEILGDATKGIDPKPENSKQKNLTLKSFIENDYKAWAQTHRKRGIETVTRIKINFYAEFGQEPLDELSPLQIEKWRSARLKAGNKASTVNRDIAALKGALSKAIEWEIIDVNPLLKLKLIKIDSTPKIRYLNKDEEIQLREALKEREEKLRTARHQANIWRHKRGYPEKTSLHTLPFADYIKPMILISLNTGLRKGELLSLKWENVNLSLAAITIEGESAKSGKTRHIPLNKEALNTLTLWHQQCGINRGLVFSNKLGEQITDTKKAWTSILKKADIQNFRWHDMRHHFASRLAMSGVDLNTVRELLGHSDIKMTLRYAHLAPEHKAQAVAKLDDFLLNGNF